jgi:hypothetical protein
MLCRLEKLYASYLLNYLLTLTRRELKVKLNCYQLIKNFPTFYWTRKFISALTIALQLSLFWIISIQVLPLHLTSWKPILIAFSRLRLGLPSGNFPSGFSTKIMHKTLHSHIHATCTAHFILINFNKRKILSE